MSIIMVFLYCFLLYLLNLFLCQRNIKPSDKVQGKYSHANILLKRLVRSGIKVFFSCIKNSFANKLRPAALFRFHCCSALSSSLTVKCYLLHRRDYLFKIGKKKLSVILGFFYFATLI